MCFTCNFKPQAKSLHRKYAEEVEKRHGGRLERVYPQLVHHFSQGDVPDKTVEYGLRMAKTALMLSARRGSPCRQEVLEFLDEEWEGDPALEGEARILLAQAKPNGWRCRRRTKRGRNGGKDLRTGEPPGAGRDRTPFRRGDCLAVQKGRGDNAVGPTVMEAARTAGDKDSLRHVLSLAATLANLRGEYEKANDYFEEAVSLAPEPKEPNSRKSYQRGRLGRGTGPLRSARLIP